MLRMDFNVVRVDAHRRWHLQDSRGHSLGKFDTVEEAVAKGRERAQSTQQRGISARLIVHTLTGEPQTQEYPVADA
jgi:hypothetical protein